MYRNEIPTVNPQIFHKNLLTQKCVCTVHAPSEKDAMMSRCLDKMEVRCGTWRVHSTRPARPVETQDGFFCRLAGQSALIGLAIIHWIGCINAIKYVNVYKNL